MDHLSQSRQAGADENIADEVPLAVIVAGILAMDEFTTEEGTLLSDDLAAAFEAGLRAALWTLGRIDGPFGLPGREFHFDHH